MQYPYFLKIITKSNKNLRLVMNKNLIHDTKQLNNNFQNKYRLLEMQNCVGGTSKL